MAEKERRKSTTNQLTDGWNVLEPDSPSSSTSSFSSTFQVNVQSYYCIDDGLSFDNHIYIIKVDVDNFSYNVDRSYVDFVNFDRQLRKRFPHTNMPLLGISFSLSIYLFIYLSLYSILTSIATNQSINYLRFEW
jgi:hypothetical protein